MKLFGRQKKGRGKRAAPRWRGRRSVISRNAKGPTDWLLTEYDDDVPILFSDGTVGIASVSDGGDFWEEWEEEEDEDGNLVNNPDDLMMDGEEYAGEVYFDRYRLSDGKFFQGGCYLFWPQDTLGSWCARNGEPMPVAALPEWVREALEEGGEAGRWKVAEYVRKMTGGKFRCHSL
ncbi:MAG: hypothetical protein IKP53_08330 [Candidatus Methanomethylophilaceae archaeon]|nr:hypothetical protein [Candidatus Methanomethylophilaceae archaeon]